MSPSLHFAYRSQTPAMLAPRLSADSNMSCSTTGSSSMMALTPRSSLSCNPGISSAGLSTSSSFGHNPLSPLELLPSKRPGLKHMPSWRSFVSSRSLASRSREEVVSSDEDETVDQEARFSDAMSDHPETVGSGKFSVRVKGMSQTLKVISSRKFRPSAASLFNRQAATTVKVNALAPSPSPSPSRHDRPSRIPMPAQAPSPVRPRVDTPLAVPLPLIAHLPAADRMPTMLETTPADDNDADDDASPEDEVEEEYFTPRAFPVSTLHKHATLPSRHPRAVLMHHPKPRYAFVKPAAEKPSFDLDIFSPRPAHPPPPPALRGVLDGPDDAISPLELASPDPDPGAGAGAGILGVLASSASFPAYRPKRPDAHPSATMFSPPSVLAASSSPANAPRAPRVSSLGGGQAGSPRSARGPSVRRHSSLSIRMPVLPCPTPPSLIDNPKQLGGPGIVSPQSDKICVGAVARRGSRRGSGLMAGGLWRSAGPFVRMGQGEEVPELQGRSGQVGMNPYFADMAGTS